MAVTFSKKSGAPAGTIRFTYGSNTYSIDDTPGATFVVNDPDAAAYLTTSPYLNKDSDTGTFTPPPATSTLLVLVDDDVEIGDVVQRTSRGFEALPLSSVAGQSDGNVKYGTGAPGSGVGQNGDSYVDTTASPARLYGPKASGVWPTSYVALGALPSNVTINRISGRISEVTDASGTTTVSYDGSNRLSSITTGEIIQTIVRDSNGRLSGVEVTTDGS